MGRTLLPADCVGINLSHHTFCRGNVTAAEIPIMHTATCKVYVTIADGVYRIQNNYSKLYMSTSDRASSLANVYQETADSGSETGLRQMWRIKYLADGYYSIRPMHNLSTALSVYNNDAYVNTASTADVLSAFPLSAWWKIGAVGNLICIYPASGSISALSLASDTTASGANITVGSNTGATRQQWLLLPVSPAPSGVRWYDNLSNPITGTPERYLTPGETKTLSALKLMPVSYNSSNISQTFEWSSSNTNVATVNASTGQVTTVAPGTATIRARKVLNGQEKLLTFTLNVTEIPNGTYFIKSKLTGKMADIENQTMADNTLIHQWECHTGSTQRWIFTHIGDGYYTIKSEYSGSTAYYLGVQNNSTEQDASIVLRSGTITDGMKWKISKTVSGAYKLMPKTGEANNRVLAIENNLLYNNNGVKIRQRNYVEDDNFKDEWFIQNTQIELPTPLLAQQTNHWCWVASAHMLARTKFPSSVNNNVQQDILSEQRQAVYHVFGNSSSSAAAYDWDNDPQQLNLKGGYYYDSGKAAAYFSSMVNGSVTYSAYPTPYSEDALITFLSDGYPILRMYGWVTYNLNQPVTLENMPSILENLSPNMGAHATVITGVNWDSQNQCFIFKVHDPWAGGSTYDMLYSDLMFSNKPTGSSRYEAELWFPSVVYKTEYSNKTFLENIFGSDYSS